jgi:hypothetical protein
MTHSHPAPVVTVELCGRRSVGAACHVAEQEAVIRQVRSWACEALTAMNALSLLSPNRSASCPVVQRYQSIIECVLART